VELIVLATRNAGKARELARLLGGVAARFETLLERPDVALPDEEGADYREIALAKARATRAALGVPAIGDDSGLEVDALGGEPGPRSARYAGPEATDAENNARLLTALAGVPAERRTARFRCVLALAGASEGGELVAEGVCEGRILDAPRGSGGFGYDPLFLPEGETMTFAELTPERKDGVSHRARAATALRSLLARAGDPLRAPASASATAPGGAPKRSGPR
jgi:XTP/dITP diphosphohydrolase